MVRFKIGDKLYYHNKYYQVVFCTITEVLKQHIIVKTEHNRVMGIPQTWVKPGFTRIEKPPTPTEKDNYLQCICESIRFYIDDGVFICNDCGSEFNSKDVFDLEQTPYIPAEEDKKIIH